MGQLLKKTLLFFFTMLYNKNVIWFFFLLPIKIFLYIYDYAFSFIFRLSFWLVSNFFSLHLYPSNVIFHKGKSEMAIRLEDTKIKKEKDDWQTGQLLPLTLYHSLLVHT